MSGIEPEALNSLVLKLSKLPGLGRKSAQRIVFYLLKTPLEEVSSLADSISDLKKRIKFCSICFNITEEEICYLCSDKRRDRKVVCVVEEATDIFALEKANESRWLYHVLGGALSPLDGINPDSLRIKELQNRLNGEVKEVVLAMNPTTEGEATALYLAKILKPVGVKITRIARGLPVGSNLDLADEVTLRRALEGRQEVIL